MVKRRGYFTLVLHAHLPYVLRHDRWPHGSDWLCEAASSCYIPLLWTFDRLIRRGVSPKVTLNISPVLVEQLADADFRSEFDLFLENRLHFCHENRSEFRSQAKITLLALTDYWEDFYRRVKEHWQKLNGDLLSAFRHLHEQGHIELITSAATHGYLPLLSRDESIDLQLEQALKTHQRHFGVAPKGIWLPECAYRPAKDSRKGIEKFLEKHGFEFFVVGASLVEAGEILETYQSWHPALRQRQWQEGSVSLKVKRSPYQTYRVASGSRVSDVSVFVRDPKTSFQVWSRDGGYPGDGGYLDFHKKHFPGGHRYWRITDTKIDLQDKQFYEPVKTKERVEAQADHFVGLVDHVLQQASDPGAIVCSPYDAELFGHWWHEGPSWIEAVLARLPQLHIESVTCSEYLAQNQPADAAVLQEGSWGEGGNHQVWLNPQTQWTWELIHKLEQRFFNGSLARPAKTSLLKRLTSQSARELLLAQSSDWQFLITTWSARDYAQRRIQEHVNNANALLDMIALVTMGKELSLAQRNLLETVEAQNRLF